MPGPKPIKLFDGHGLFLLLQTNGAKYWRLKYRFNGKEKLLSLGTYPAIPLRAARQQGKLARELLAQGTDPGEYFKEKRQAEKDAAARQHTPTRFSIDNTGALSIHLGRRNVALTATETAELRAFLKATTAVSTGNH